MVQQLQQQIREFGEISVSYAQQKMQNDKKAAFEMRQAELVNKYENLNNEIRIKMRQHLDLALQRKMTLSSQRDSFSRSGTGMDDVQRQLLAGG